MKITQVLTYQVNLRFYSYGLQSVTAAEYAGFRVWGLT